MEALLILVIVASLLAIGYAAFNFASVKRLDEGTDRMKEIASAIRVGANAFIEYEYKIIAVVVAVIAVIFMIIFTIQYKAFSWEPSVCFIIGVVMSALAGYVGMKIATYSNVRVSNTARQTKDIGKTLKVALKGGSVMGLCVGGFALLGLFLVYHYIRLWIGTYKNRITYRRTACVHAVSFMLCIRLFHSCHV